MIYLLWALLNIGLSILFIGICGIAAKLIYKKSGVLTSSFFVLGMLSFIGRSNVSQNNKDPNFDQLKFSELPSTDSLANGATSFVEIDFEKTLISKYSLVIRYGKDKQLLNSIPVSAKVNVNGWEVGTSWESLSLTVLPTDNNQEFLYHVNGLISWSVLGSTIVSQYKSWEGIATLK